MLRTLTVLLGLASLSACGTFSADYKKESVNWLTGKPVTVSRNSKEKVLAEESSKQIVALAGLATQKVNLDIAKIEGRQNCDYLSADKLALLSAGLKTTYFQGVSECIKDTKLFELVNNMVDAMKSMSGAKSEVTLVAEANERAIKHVATEGTNRFVKPVESLASFGKFTVGLREVGKTTRSISNDSFKTADTVARNNSGDITVSGISSSQSPSLDPSTGGMGEGSSSSSGTLDNTKTGDTFVIGTRNTLVRDSGQALVETDTSQIISPSGTGLIVNDSNSDQATAADENNGSQSNQPFSTSTVEGEE